MASPIPIHENENDSQSITMKKNSKDHTYDFDWIKNTTASSFFNHERHPLKKPVTDQGCQKRLSKYNGLVNRMTSEQVDDELRKRQLSTW